MAGPDPILTTNRLGRELARAQHQIDLHRGRAYVAVLQAQQRGTGKDWAAHELRLLRAAEAEHANVLAQLLERCRPYQVDTVEGITRDPQGQALVQAIIDRQPRKDE